jgi:enoyl-[acyl-carrier protein] reductase III
MPEYAVVGASKAALEALVRYLGVELAPSKIVVNAVSPGLVITEAIRHFSLFGSEGATGIEEVRERTPARRICEPEDVAGIVNFLCTPAAAMICGQVLVVDGGYSHLARV